MVTLQSKSTRVVQQRSPWNIIAKVEKTQHARGFGSRHPALGSASEEHPAAPLLEEFGTRIAVSSAMKVHSLFVPIQQNALKN